ncbi:ALK tyrosine kinase receptor-like [Dendronephthya gigantea]|uniref:ALK tyrosine kinase receptor-like n=1 Tax=Dendronephthya gigantea TaxID=151771 RepID=UPI00106C5816|nr:ALK tyrosine kinase receptor-like [Dendronephthya gigantea]
MVTLTNGIQFWTVPYTGTYEITAVGAAGGYDKYGLTARSRGAYMRGEFNFEKGDVIKILVGQTAPMNNQHFSSGGGGGSFVAKSSKTPLIIAGGEGGVEHLTDIKGLLNNAFHANFTSLGATGRLGPSSLGSYYVGKDNENMVTLRNGIQFWTVPYTGTYEITAVGAAGGYDAYGSTARGRGAYMRGEFNFQKRDVIKILVGQTAPVNSASRSSGGGGGSFVATSSNIPLIVAGGGGGVQDLGNRMANCDAKTRTSGRRNQCEHSCAIWSGGKNGSGALEADNDNSGNLGFYRRNFRRGFQ